MAKLYSPYAFSPQRSGTVGRPVYLPVPMRQRINRMLAIPETSSPAAAFQNDVSNDVYSPDVSRPGGTEPAEPLGLEPAVEGAPYAGPGLLGLSKEPTDKGVLESFPGVFSIMTGPVALGKAMLARTAKGFLGSLFADKSDPSSPYEGQYTYDPSAVATTQSELGMEGPYEAAALGRAGRGGAYGLGHLGYGLGSNLGDVGVTGGTNFGRGSGWEGWDAATYGTDAEGGWGGYGGEGGWAGAAAGGYAGEGASEGLGGLE